MKKFLVLVLMLGIVGSAVAVPPPVGTVTYHLDAGTLGLADGTGVSTWAAAVGPTATTSNSLYDPIYNTNVINGMPAVTFDAADDHMDLASSVADSSTAIVVRRWNGPTTGADQNFYFYGDPDRRFGERKQDGGDGSIRVEFAGDNTAYGWINSLHGVFEVTTVVCGDDMYLNGVAMGVPATVPFTGINLLGAERSATHVSGLDNGGPDVTIAEMILYDTALGAGDRLAVEQYLGTKYGIQVVPEPATIMLFGLGGLALLRKRK